MRDNQLSAEDQRKVTEALAKCAAETKAIEDKDKLADSAYKILRDTLGDNPRLIKVACRVYNSCKSIYKLSSAGDDNRGDSFALLDANGLADRSKRDTVASMAKKASSAFTLSVVAPEIDYSNMSLEKAASSGSSDKRHCSYFDVDRSDLLPQVRTYVNTVTKDCEDLLRKCASTVRIAEKEFCEAIESFITVMTTSPAAVRKEAMAQSYSSSATFTKTLVDCFNSERPLQKVASEDYVNRYKGSARIKDEDIRQAVRLVKEANDKLADARAAQEVVLAQVADETAGLFALVKHAAGMGAIIGATAVTGAAKDLPDVLGLTEEPVEKIKQKIYTNKVINRQLQHSAERMFINLIQDSNIAKYPMPDIVRAYNQALSKLPVNMRLTPVTAHAALIKSDVISNLAEGGVASKADVDKIVNILGAYNRLRAKNGLITENASE